jgi:F-type H+-transporting ATPase subunit epsilon
LAIDLVIVTPEGQAYSGEVEQVVLPGSEGDFGVLAEHERTLAPLQHGAVEIKTAAGSEWAAISNGFAEVAAERVVVLADSCVLAAAVDKTAVEADMTEAQAELDGLADTEENTAKRTGLGEAIRQCEVRLEVAAK